jgi:hypothetical protein
MAIIIKWELIIRRVLQLNRNKTLLLSKLEFAAEEYAKKGLLKKPCFAEKRRD